jgi:antitoxin (DNA-binding transcriptional repressor) of toxin-antitoxin stability system
MVGLSSIYLEIIIGENMSVHIVSLQEAEGHLAELAELAKQGNDVRITIGHEQVVKLVSDQNEPKHQRTLGLHEGQGWMSDDFNAPVGENFLWGEA